MQELIAHHLTLLPLVYLNEFKQSKQKNCNYGKREIASWMTDAYGRN